MPNSPQDLHKKVLGKKGEKLALEYLKKQGYKLLKKNYRTPFGEADILMQDGEETVFVEVKTRTGNSFGAPREAVGSVKQSRYYKIAECYWLETRREPNARFDVVEVYADGKIEHFKNAF